MKKRSSFWERWSEMSLVFQVLAWFLFQELSGKRKLSLLWWAVPIVIIVALAYSFVALLSCILF